MSNVKPVGILLAAGYSRRFGADKLLVPLPDGTPVAVAAARCSREGMALAFGDDARIVAVIRPEQTELAALLGREGIETLMSDAARRGMGASLAAAVTATTDAAGWIVALGDMPFLRPETVAAVARALAEGASVAAPIVDGRRGHPVGFSVAFSAALRRLDGDRGARQIIDGLSIELLPCADTGALRDIDLPADILNR